jgi:nucleotide-binding universal stress UspA family protein
MQILMTTHGAPHDEVALRFGAEIAHRADKLPTVLTVIRHERDRPQGDAVLALARGILEMRGLKARTKLRIGHPAAEIVREAEESDHGLVIVGDSQAHSLMTRFLQGSTAVRVVEHSPCPVIVARGRANPIRRILLCDSGAESPSVSLRAGPSVGLPSAPLGTGGAGPSVLGRFTAQLGGLLKGEEEVTILHVMSQMSAGPGVEGKPLRAGAEELIARATPEGEVLEQDFAALERLGVHARAEVRHGLVVDEIMGEAKRGNHDLVVIGAYRGEGWQRILLDDLAHKILVQLDRPVLIVR